MIRESIPVRGKVVIDGLEYYMFEAGSLKGVERVSF
jgi:hypothetical protein